VVLPVVGELVTRLLTHHPLSLLRRSGVSVQ
jgi:hypothetical protein